MNLRPEIAVVTGIEPDHFDCYATFDELVAAFQKFAGNVAIHGLVLVKDDCRAARQVARLAGCRSMTFGFDERSDWRVDRLCSRQGRYRFRILRGGEPLLEHVDIPRIQGQRCRRVSLVAGRREVGLRYGKPSASLPKT